MILICELKDGVVEDAVGPAANELSKLPGVLEVVATGGIGMNIFDPAIKAIPTKTRIAFILSFKDNESSRNGLAKWNAILKDNGYMEKIDRVIAYDAVAKNYLVSEEYKAESTAADLQRRTAAAKQLEEQRSRTK
ncbi:MAG: hypothetical protein QM754_13535 [Tepidisphaeraceae bacterium]